MSQHVIDLFVEAARSSPTIDADVHVSLGLLYNCTWEYDKALECFKVWKFNIESLILFRQH